MVFRRAGPDILLCFMVALALREGGQECAVLPDIVMRNRQQMFCDFDVASGRGVAVRTFAVVCVCEATYEKENVRAAFPLPGACPAGDTDGKTREGVACGRCQDGYYGGGPTCTECEGGATAGGAIMIILVPFVIACIYRGPRRRR